MDPVTHTLAGLALARTGLARRTALGTATLVLAANLPDVDGVAYFGPPALDLAWRRGWTHGVLALFVLPFLLAGAMLLADRLLARLGRASIPGEARPGQLLLLSFVGVWSHPVLDTLNTYGVRWLMPFAGTWFYGDTLFIVDPWLLGILAAGVLLARRWRRARDFALDPARPARAAVAVAALYVVLMAAGALAARRMVRSETGGEALMVAPRPVTPFSRYVVVADGAVYRTGTFRWLGTPHLDPASVETHPRPAADDPLLAQARATEVGRRFLGWARFPVARLVDGGTAIELADLRYAVPGETSFAVVRVPVRGAPPVHP
jgi:inner membrane protein